MAIPQSAIDRFKQFEGVIAHMYLDSEGFVTIGVGHLLANAEAAISLALINKQTEATASEAEKKQEWNTINGKESPKKASFYEPFTKLKLKTTDIETLLKADLEGLEKDLKDIYSQYESLPQAAKEGLLDMIFNLGKNGLKTKFPKFNQAVNAQDWATAAKECKRGGISDERNTAIRTLFESLVPPLPIPTFSGFWNLTDAVSKSGERRAFFLPLASIPPEKKAVRTVDKSVFNIEETYTSAGDRTTDVGLAIRITPPFSGFTDEEDLPDPAIRLHAMVKGRLSFQPANGTLGDRLILQTFVFSQSFTNARWWERWIEAGCLPQTIVYENVDRAHLETLLNGLSVPANDTQTAPATYGLRVPLGVMQATKADFISKFLSGVAGVSLTAEAGAYIGRAGLAPGAVESPIAVRLVRLHVQYHDHTDVNPHPMNPRELFHLLFGNDSDEARNHPLLRQMHELGQKQTTIQPESKRMLLRPPLRTWKRVEWEADQEIQLHSANWRPAGSLGDNRFYNNHRRNNRSFNDGNYDNFNKCNLFVSDICLRAGFRINLHPVGAAAWHYIDANSYTNLAHQGTGTTDRVALQGRNEDAAVPWGWKFENWLRAKPAGDRQRLLNDAMTKDGRCFILAGARARRFVNQTLPNGAQGIADCTASLRRNGIGHIVIVKEVLAQPTLATTVGEGLQQIRVQTMEASGSGATNRDFDAQLGGAGGNAAGTTGFIRLHLIELHPGKDPDTLQGLRDLNISSINRNLIDTANERAANTPLNRNPNGTVRPPGKCCQDQHPANGNPIEVNC